MTDYVLVHGGWHGGWCWREVAALLTGRGHRVFAPSLTGLAERGHLIDCVEGPDTHVEDIVRLVEWEGLEGFTLVGHSYGGTIVTGVASRMPERISRLVYLDAMVPEVSNQSAAALSNPQRAAEVAAARRPDGHTDLTGFERWVSPERIEWLKSMATPQPGSCFGKGVTLTGRQHEVAEKDYIICLRHKPSPFWAFYEKYKDAPGWRSHELDCLHDAMIEMPEALVDILDPAPMSQSNLLILMSDEHQARAMGNAGHPQIRTPNLDALAARGTVFENAYTPSPICVPARAAFATGRHVHETRLWDNAMPYSGQIPGWGHALQEAGVPVESIGKLHYRAKEDPAGFDVEHIPMMVANGVGMVWGSIRREDERCAARGRMLGEYIGPGKSKYTEYDRSVTEHAERWFEDRAASGDARPWCLYVGLVAPHFPLVVPQEYFDLYPLDSIAEPKLAPSTGYRRHPWVEKQNEHMDSEAMFADPEERLKAIASYYGLCTWLDHNVGRILNALAACGFGENTTVVYTSDHGDNLGTRGLWGKSTLYQESTAIPLIMAGPGVPARRCSTPVSLLDLSVTIPAHFGVDYEGAEGLQTLDEIADAPDDPVREVFSEYHAVGAVSGAYMLRHGRWKYHYYVDFPPELFDLETDPEETRDLAGDPAFAPVLADMERRLRRICDPEAVNARAFADQDAMIEGYGGREAALSMGARGATPPPA